MFNLAFWILALIAANNAKFAAGCHYDLYTAQMVCPAQATIARPAFTAGRR